MPEESVTVGGRHVAYLDEGPREAPTVLLLHGGGIDRAARAWSGVLPDLSADHRVIAPDLAGYGGSDPLGRSHDLPELGGWLVAFLDAIAAPPAVVVGSSMGGALALWLALHHPDRVRGVAAVGSYGLAPRALAHPLVWLWAHMPGGALLPAAVARSPLAARAALAAVYSDPRRITAAQVRELRAEAPLQARRQAFRGFLRGEVTPWRFRSAFGPALKRVACPVLVIHGQGDRLVGWRHARRAAQSLPRGRLLLMDAGHWPMREQPADFAAALRGFLEECGASGIEQTDAK